METASLFFRVKSELEEKIQMMVLIMALVSPIAVRTFRHLFVKY